MYLKKRMTAIFFVDAKSEEDAIEYIKNCIKLYVEKYTLKSTEKYWKISDISIN